MSQEWKLVPKDPAMFLDMGWAYLDAAREAEPNKNWSFSHAGYKAMLAAAPVLPAGEEPGAVEGLRQLVIGSYPDPDVEDAHDDYLDEHQPQALWLLRNAGRIEIHITRLQAENAALQQHLNVADQQNDELKTDLAQAKHLLKFCSSPTPAHCAQVLEFLETDSAVGEYRTTQQR